MCTDNVEQFWMSRGHAYHSMLQKAVVLVFCARPDMYLRHFLLQQRLIGIWCTFPILGPCVSRSKCSHICRRGHQSLWPEPVRKHFLATVSGEGQPTLHSSPWCQTGDIAEELLKCAHSWLHQVTCFLLKILFLSKSNMEEKHCGGDQAPCYVETFSINCEGSWAYLKRVLLLATTICSLRIRASHKESRAVCPSAVHQLLLKEHRQRNNRLQQDLRETGTISCHIAGWQENKCFYAYRDVTSLSVM